MTTDLLRTLLVYLIGGLAVGACFYLVISGKGNQDQTWNLLILLLTALVINEARNQGASSARKTAAESRSTTINTAPDQPVTVNTGEGGAA